MAAAGLPAGLHPACRRPVRAGCDEGAVVAVRIGPGGVGPPGRALGQNHLRRPADGDALYAPGLLPAGAGGPEPGPAAAGERQAPGVRHGGGAAGLLPPAAGGGAPGAAQNAMDCLRRPVRPGGAGVWLRGPGNPPERED